MRTYEKSTKLDNVCYDIRGPVMDEANRMQAAGIDVLKLNIGNPAPFGFHAPDEVIKDMSYNLRDTEGYSDSKGLFSARKAIMQYCQLKHIPNVGIDDIYTGNGVSELITMSMQGLLNNGDARTSAFLKSHAFSAKISLVAVNPSDLISKISYLRTAFICLCHPYEFFKGLSKT